MRNVALLLALLPFGGLQADPPEDFRLQYIERYAPLAVAEMQRSGIPASITLAQGILESGWGQSQLALQSNNHFGIKCKEYWEGPTVYWEDDDFDAQGRKIKSCFRAYADPVESYRDHSEFLMNNPRYAELFQYPVTDYRSWAFGLKRCGYATLTDYAERLIALIEEHQLYLYDRATPLDAFAVAEDPFEESAPSATVPGQPLSRPPLPGSHLPAPQTALPVAPEVRALPPAFLHSRMKWLGGD